MTHENKLKPCPFCGGDAEYIASAMRVSCVSGHGWCNAEQYGDTQAIAQQRWNTRAPTPQPDPQFSNYQTEGGQ